MRSVLKAVLWTVIAGGYGWVALHSTQGRVENGAFAALMGVLAGLEWQEVYQRHRASQRRKPSPPAV